MPNWVFNSIGGYTKDTYEKYKGEDTDIDFNKIIPQPEELNRTVSGSYNTLGKEIVSYLDYKAELEKQGKEMTKYDHNNPLYDNLQTFQDSTIRDIGIAAVENPDKSLNEIVKDNENLKYHYDMYTNVFGNNGQFSNANIGPDAYDKYVEALEKDFQNSKRNSKYVDYSYYDSLEDMGRKAKELKEKYGYEDWYGWRNANWGVKWNASSTSYDEENETIHFDTPWAIPYPVIAKIAEDNKQLQLDGYSEEEGGWFDEYTSKDGIVTVNKSGDNIYNEESDSPKVVYDEKFKPYSFDYSTIAKQSIKDYDNLKKMSDNIAAKIK